MFIVYCVQKKPPLQNAWPSMAFTAGNKYSICMSAR